MAKHKNFSKSAFTLSEVLITLGIIGVVSAMTIPTLMTKYQKAQTVTKLKKAISQISQAYKMAYDDVGEATPEEAIEMGLDNYFEKYWMPYIKTNLICNPYTKCGYKASWPFYTTTGQQAGFAVNEYTSRLLFSTMDGFVYIVFIKAANEPSSMIVVDINGGEGPNKYGRDVFSLERLPDGRGVTTMGYERNDAFIKNSCNKTNNVTGARDSYCAELIRRAGWQIPDDYPW